MTFRKSPKILLNHLNSFIQCRLCYGYLIEPTTLTDCFHTFCFSCIVKFIVINDKKTLCPICGTSYNVDNPLQNFQHDEQLQALIFKMVPNLYKTELSNRLQFYKNKHINRPRKLFHYNSSNEFRVHFDQMTIKLVPIGINKQPHRYLKCSIFTRVSHLIKLLEMKFLEMGMCNVKIIFLNYIVPSNYRLIDFFYIFQKEFDISNEPMEIYYEWTKAAIERSLSVQKLDDYSLESSSPSSLPISSPTSDSDSSSSYGCRKKSKRRRKRTKTFHAQAFCSSDLKLRLKLTHKPVHHRKKKRKRSKTADSFDQEMAITKIEPDIPIWSSNSVVGAAQYSDLRVCGNETIVTAVKSQIVRMIPAPKILITQKTDEVITWNN